MRVMYQTGCAPDKVPEFKPVLHQIRNETIRDNIPQYNHIRPLTQEQTEQVTNTATVITVGAILTYAAYLLIIL